MSVRINELSIPALRTAPACWSFWPHRDWYPAQIRQMLNQLGHSLDVSQNVYTQSLVESKPRAVSRLEKSLLVNGGTNGAQIEAGLCKLLNHLERETGIEPATFSLGS
jgi:hypothetical protein